MSEIFTEKSQQIKDFKNFSNFSNLCSKRKSLAKYSQTKVNRQKDFSNLYTKKLIKCKNGFTRPIKKPLPRPRTF
jgi:hypothetical protein